MTRQVARLLRLRELWPAIGAAAGLIAVYIVSFFVGMDWSGVAVGTVVAIASAPVFTSAVEWMRDARRLTGRQMSAAAVTIGGGALLVASRAVVSRRPCSSFPE